MIDLNEYIIGSETEEFFLPYEDNEIFSYLDNQEVCKL